MDIAGATKILILIMAAYPFIDVAFVHATFHTPFAGSKFVTQGDVLIVLSQMLIAMYVFELFYLTKVSPVSGTPRWDDHHWRVSNCNQLEPCEGEGRNDRVHSVHCLGWAFPFPPS
jgi:hypothetical protein